LYGLVDFTVQAWNGAAWVTVATVAGNNLVKRSVSFAAVNTDRIRVNVTRVADGTWTRIVEVEAWTGAGGPVTTTTSLASSLNPSTVGASVTLTATVTGTAPTGSVAFSDGGNAIAGCAAVALTGAGNARTATCTTSAFAQGTHSLVASYGGDGGNAPSASAVLSQAVNQAGGAGGDAGCGPLSILDLGAFRFTDASTYFALGEGDKQVAILSYTATVADVGKSSNISVFEFGSDQHYYTVWVSRNRCEMTAQTKQQSSSAPLVNFTVNGPVIGTPMISMQPGDTWYVMIRNWDYKRARNSCNAATCGTVFKAYAW
jgi:hypothetical protein